MRTRSSSASAPAAGATPSSSGSRAPAASTVLRFRLDPTTEWGYLGGTVRPAAEIPAHDATLRLGDLVEGRLEHDIAVDVHTDKITLQVVDLSRPLDQSFEYTDTAASSAAATTTTCA